MAAQDQPLDSDRDSIQDVNTFANSRADKDFLTLEEIGTLAAEGGNPAETLMNVVALIAKRFGADVCSAYLLEPDRANLVLAATVGLLPQCIGTLRMTLHEGLTGLVAEEVRPVAVGTAKNHPRFKFFMDAGEEAYESFLGVPLVDRGVLQGVLVVQTVDARIFRDEEIQMLVSAAAQVAPVVSEARTLARFIAPVQERLWALARNLWWSWDPDSTNLFLDVDPARWRQLNQNTVALLGEMSLAKLERRAEELVLHSRIHYAYRRQQEYLDADRTWGATHAGVLRPRPVAYFSAEFGLHESFPVYSGGLGILAGDHIKSASDLDIPLVGVGLFYRQGYFRQRLDRDGWQHEDYLKTDINQLPMEPAIGVNGEPVTIGIVTRSTAIHAKVWRVKVGRCDLFLLDSDVSGNAPEDRDLTSRLYGGDERERIRQELLLGVGGFRALKAMGIATGVLHLNEGHSAFAVLEAIRCRMEEEGVGFEGAAPPGTPRIQNTKYHPIRFTRPRDGHCLISTHREEIVQLIGAASRLRESYPLRRHVYATMLGLIAATGLRISEALDLRLYDVLPDGVLQIRRTKFGKSRLIPLHPTAANALDWYLEERRRLAVTDDHVFLSAGNQRIAASTVGYTFRRIRRLAGIAPARTRPPRIHDLRHTFATRALEQCSTRREAVARHFVALATYMGHTDIAHTYWYLEATPELMTDIARAAEALIAKEGI